MDFLLFWTVYRSRTTNCSSCYRFPNLLDSGLGYSGLNTARCALSTFTVLEGNISIGSHPLVKRFLKAAYQIRPSFPRYQFMWDTSIVLTYLRDLPSVQELSLKTLTLKLTMLRALVTGQRCQSLHLMNWNSCLCGLNSASLSSMIL